ncbi:MAG: hypothetical protein Q8760_00860 [Candidatus Phytoplasma australasiaticum]|nr:hypothetical protein [Candidatus Phytoplasma australasiaticum]
MQILYKNDTKKHQINFKYNLIIFLIILKIIKNKLKIMQKNIHIIKKYLKNI